MLTKSEFEIRYNREIVLLNVGESVSFNSALDSLYGELKRLEGNEDKFKDLLKEWELV
jgi:hypothetical protein